MEAQTYVLTDGNEIVKCRTMTQEEYREAQAQAERHTADNWWWCPVPGDESET